MPIISIHALREESDLSLLILLSCFHISIHALREESDKTHQPIRLQGIISIHALREESDHMVGATVILRDDFNPRSP